MRVIGFDPAREARTVVVTALTVAVLAGGAVGAVIGGVVARWQSAHLARVRP